jgi:hypothetical protein
VEPVVADHVERFEHHRCDEDEHRCPTHEQCNADDDVGDEVLGHSIFDQALDRRPIDA